jgi:hypothetical protein
MGADAWPGMSVVIGANNRSSNSNIIWTCSIESRVPWRDRSRWSRGVRPVSGQRASTGSGKHWQKHGQEKLQKAVETALSNRCYDSAAVQHLLSTEDLRHTACEAIDVGVLERYARPMPAMLEYDQLLSAGGGR